MAKKIKEIVSGWTKVLFTNAEVEVIAEKRLSICNACPFKDSMMGIDCCSLCHCPLISKTRSLTSECPKNYWAEQNKEPNDNSNKRA